MNGIDETTSADHAGVAFRPPVLLLAALAIGFGLRWIVPLPFLPERMSSTIGLPVVGISFAIFVWAVVTMLTNKASIPTSKPTEAIVMRGPFRFSRNPIYLSMIMLIFGTGVWVNSVWYLALAALAAALLNWGVIKREENYLERKFGDGYRAYKSRVRRWI